VVDTWKLLCTLDELARSAGRREYARALTHRFDAWVPASGGTETPYFQRDGRRVLYCWNPQLSEHALLDLGTDIFLDEV
jgi:hypothetical protein